MSGVFRNIDPSPPHRPASVWEATLAGWRGGGGSIVRKTPDTALHSKYVSTLWLRPSQARKGGEGEYRLLYGGGGGMVGNGYRKCYPRLDKEVMGNYIIYFHPVLRSQSRSQGPEELKLNCLLEPEPEPKLRIAAPAPFYLAKI
jgi:hypothetical protein